MKTLLNVIAVAASMTAAACLAPSGDATVDRNRDGIADTQTGSVRGVDEVLLNLPSSPVGSLFGSVYNAYTGEPIASQQIVIYTGKDVVLRATTDAQGGFTVSYVGQGAYRLAIDANGMMPFRFQGGVDPNGNFDNNNIYVGKIYLFPTDGTTNLTFVSEDGTFLSNLPVTANITTGFVDGRTSVGAGQVNLAEFSQVNLTTNAVGGATLTGLPNFLKIARLRDFGAGVVELITPTHDVEGDSIQDFGGSANIFSADDLRALNNNIVVSNIRALHGNGFNVVASNAYSSDRFVRAPAGGDGTRLDTIRYFNPTTPFVFVFNQPVDPASVSVSLINAFTSNAGTVANPNWVLANSEPQRIGQGAAVDAFDANTKPATGTATATVAVDATGTVLTITPTNALPAGAEVLVRGSVGVARHGTFGPNTQAQETFEFRDRWGAFIKPAAATLSIPTVFIERNAGENGFHRITLVTSHVVRGFFAGWEDSSVPPTAIADITRAFIYVCADDDLNSDLDRINQATGVIDQGECPDDPNFSWKGADVAQLIRAQLRENSPETRFGTGQFWTFDNVGSIGPGGNGNSQLIFNTSRQVVHLRVVNPLVDNQVLGFNEGNQLATPDGVIYGFGMTANADVTLPPAAGSNVRYDFPTSLNNFVFAP